MRKEISPELFNYNKYPGPEFRLVSNQVLAEQLTFELVENQNDAFDTTVFGQRFSEVLTNLIILSVIGAMNSCVYVASIRTIVRLQMQRKSAVWKIIY